MPVHANSLNNVVGLLGEYKILEFFTKNSIHSAHSDVGSTDIVCFSDKERPLRVQVKTISSWEKGANCFKVNRGVNRTAYNKNEFEILALVVLDFNDIFFLNSEAMGLIVGSSNKYGSIGRHSLLAFTKNQTHAEGWNRAIRGLYPSYEIETKHEFIEYSSEEKNYLIGKYKYYLNRFHYDTSFIKQDSITPSNLEMVRQKKSKKSLRNAKYRSKSHKDFEKIKLSKKLQNARYYKKKKALQNSNKNNKVELTKRNQEKNKNESRISRLYGNGFNNSKRSEGQLQQTFLL